MIRLTGVFQKEGSNRKPCNSWAGYVASRRNKISGDWNVIVKAAEHGLDDSDGKYAVVCNAHSTICNFTSIPKARPFMKLAEFCEECMKQRRQP